MKIRRIYMRHYEAKSFINSNRDLKIFEKHQHKRDENDFIRFDNLLRLNNISFIIFKICLDLIIFYLARD